MNASVSTNWSKTVAILEAATFVGGNIIGGNFQFLPGFCRWCGALLTPMLGAVVLFCLNDFVHRGGAPLESLAMVQLLCLSFQDDALESMPMRTHKTDYLRTRYWVQMPAFITI